MTGSRLVLDPCNFETRPFSVLMLPPEPWYKCPKSSLQEAHRLLWGGALRAIILCQREAERRKNRDRAILKRGGVFNIGAEADRDSWAGAIGSPRSLSPLGL
jgi:hypothetical protein